MKNKIFLLLYLLLPYLGWTQVTITNLPLTPNGEVLCQKKVGNTLYLGGNFTGFSANTGNLANIQITGNSAALAAMAKVTGIINSLASDNNGGFFVGGQFTSIGGLSRLNLARIDNAGNVLPLNVRVNGTVTKVLFTSTGRLFVFGNFGTITINSTNSTRMYAAEINPSGTGSLAPWNANISSGTITDAILDNNRIFVSGRAVVNSSTRCLWGYDISTGNPTILTSFNPIIWQGTSASNAMVNTLAIGGGQLYFGGIFNKLNGSTRNNLASVNLTGYVNGPVNLAFNTGSSVTSICWNNNMLYIGGTFSTIGGNAYARLCAYNTSLNSLMVNWPPSPNGSITKLGIAAGKLWVSGNFNLISNVSANYFGIYSLDPTNFTPPVILNPFPVSFNGLINDIIVNSQGNLIAGGNFGSISTGIRSRVAAIDLLTNAVTGFAPVVNGPVYAIEVAGSNVFLGGSFSQVNYLSNNNFAVVNAGSGLTNTNYKANFSGPVNAILAINNNIYVGGDYSMATVYNSTGATNYVRNGLISLNLGASALTNNAAFNSSLVNVSGTTSIKCIKTYSNNLYIGGLFNSPRVGVACISPANGSLLTAFNAGLVNTSGLCYVNDLQLTPQNELVIGGYLGSGSVTNIRYVNPSTGVMQRQASGVSGNTLFNAIPTSIALGNSNEIYYTNSNGLMRTSNTSGTSMPLYNAAGLKNIVGLGNNLYCMGGLFNYINSSGFYQSNLILVSPNTLAAPTNAASAVTFSNVSTTSMNISWTPGNGNKKIVLMRALQTVTGIPVNNETYNSSAVYGNGYNLGGAFVVHNSNLNNVTVSNLQPGTLYYVKVFEYNENGSFITYETTGTAGQRSTLPLAPPTQGAVSLTASNVTKNSMMLNLVGGDGNGRIIVAREGAPVNAIPVLNTRYTGSASFGFGNDLGNQNYVVKTDNTYPFLLSNLHAGTTYYFSVFEYNEYGYQVVYNTSLVLSANYTTLPDVVEPSSPSSGLSVSNLGGGSARVSWVSGSGSNRIVLACLVNASYYNQSINITDGSSFIANPNMSSFTPNPGSVDVTGPFNTIYQHRVVYTGGANFVDVTGLNSSSYYSFIVIDYNTAGPGTENYLQSAWISTLYATPALVQPPNQPATNVNMISSTGTEALIGWNNGNGSNRIVIAKQGAPVNFVPSNNVSYSANAVFGLGTNYNGGNYVVFNGANPIDKFTIYGLTPYTDYYFAVYEFNQAYNSYTLQNEIKYIPIPGTGSGKTQPPNWPRTAGGTGTDAAGGMSKDGSGNIYVAGTFSGNSYFGTIPVTGASNDIFLAKYTSAGLLLWVQTAGGSAEDAASSVVTDNAGNSYIIGSFRSTARFGTSTMVSSNGSDDAFIAKYNTAGDLQWVRTMGGTDQDVAFWAALDNAGNLVVTGYFKGNPSFSNSTQTLTSNGNSDVFVAKYDASGNLLWSTGAGGTGYDYGHSVTIGASNSVIICGEYKLNATFGTNTLTNTGTESNAFVAKLTSAGAWDWARSMGGPGTDAAYSVTSDANDNYYLAGVFNGTATFGLTNLTSAGLADAFVARVNTNGTIQWATQFGGVSNDNAFGVTMAANGNIFVAGGFADNITINGNTLSSAGSQDVIMVSVTNNGIITQALKFGGNKNDQARGIIANNTGDAFICGYFEGIAVFGGYELRAKGNISSSQQTGDMFVYNVSSVYSSNPNADIIAWYKMNGNTNDASGNNFNGTPVNSPVFVADRNATANSAMQFSNSYITASITSAPQFDNISEFTYAGWVKLNTYLGGNTQLILRSYAGLADNLYLYMSGNGVINFFLYDGSATQIAALYSSDEYALPLNTWKHIAFTFKTGNYIQFYVDGVLQNMTGIASSSVFNYLTGFNNKTLYLGIDGYGLSTTASLDDVRLYKRALTQTEISNLLTLSSPNSSPPMDNSKQGKTDEPVSSVLYPNPNKGEFNLLLQQNTDRVLSFRITDMSGKTVYQENNQLFESGAVIKSFQLENIQNGYYLLQLIENEKVVENHKLIVHP